VDKNLHKIILWTYFIYPFIMSSFTALRMLIGWHTWHPACIKYCQNNFKVTGKMAAWTEMEFVCIYLVCYFTEYFMINIGDCNTWICRLLRLRASCLHWMLHIMLTAECAHTITRSYNQCDTRTHQETGFKIFTCRPRWKISLYHTEIPHEVCAFCFC